MKPILPALSAALLALAACSRGPSGPVPAVSGAGAASAAAVAAPSAEVQAAFLKQVQAALKSGRPERLLALAWREGASGQGHSVQTAHLRSTAEDCAGKYPCKATIAPSARYADLHLTAPAFGDLVVERTTENMQTRAKFPVGVKDGKIVIVTEAQ